MNKSKWVSPQLNSLNQDLIKSAMNPTNAFAEYYSLVVCAVQPNAAGNAAAMAACSMNGVSGDSYTAESSCVVTALGPDSWAPGNDTFSTFGNGCCPGASPFGGTAAVGGVLPGSTVTAMAACS